MRVLGGRFALALIVLATTVYVVRRVVGDRAVAQPNVIVILIDTLRADHLGIYGYERDTSPVLDRFAREHSYVSHAMSAASWTPPSVASLLTGLYASVHGHMPLRSETDYGKRFTKLDESFTTLSEIFKGAGYATAAISANPLVGERYGFKQGFDLFVSPGRERADKVNRRAIKYLSDLRPKEKPFFLYLHYLDPHDPYEPPAPYDTLFKGPLKGRDYPELQVGLMEQYDGEIRYTDEKIGELFDWLRAHHLYEDLQIYIVSDHGEQFMERGYQGHADRVFSEEIHVPFIFKVQGNAGRIEQVVSTVDLFPTVLDAAGIQYSHQVQGFSLLQVGNQRRNIPVIAEIIRHVNQKAMIFPDKLKLVREFPMSTGLLALHGAQPSEERLYDLSSDLFEQQPIEEFGRLEALRKEFNERYAEIVALKKGYTTGETQLDEKSLEQLRSLGYL